MNVIVFWDRFTKVLHEADVIYLDFKRLEAYLKLEFKLAWIKTNDMD